MNDGNIALMVETALMEGQLAAGVAPSVVASRSPLGSKAVAALVPKSGGTARKAKSPSWISGEDQFLKSYLGILSEKEMAEALGRSEIAIHLRWKRDLKLPAPSKHPDMITGEQIAQGMGVDGKKAALLIDRGILYGHRLPSERTIRVVSRTILLMFLTNPRNWCYFDPRRVGSKPRRSSGSFDYEFWSKARRLVRKRMFLWKDKWLRIGEAARCLGIEQGVLNNAIRKGKIPATDWGNWRLLKSDVEKAKTSGYFRGTGKDRKGEERLVLSSSAEAFLVLAEAVGMFHTEIGALMRWDVKRISYVLRRLHQKGRIPGIIRESGLRVLYDRKGELFADWRMYSGRFPRLAMMMKHLKKGSRMTCVERKCFDQVKRKAFCYAKRLNRIAGRRFK